MNENEKIEQIKQSTNFIRNWSMDFLSNMGISDQWIKYINLIFLIGLLIIAVYIVQVITRTIVTAVLKNMTRLKKLSFLKYLIKRRFPHYVSMIVPFSIIKGTIPIIFFDFPKSILFIDKLADIYIIFYIIWLLSSILSAFGDMLFEKENLKDKPIESYLQVVKIFLYSIGVIILISILAQKSPTVLLGGLGAASAILMLVFKDTILGFVASIQISTNDMVRIGDWITMKKFDADGDVFQITLTTVKIRNFDKTITTIPPYSLISESFQNWRGMQEVGGRRIKRSIFIKQSSIRFIETDEELEKFKRVQGIRDYIEERHSEILQHNKEIGADKSLPVNGRNLTNMGLFRSYIEWYLHKHPQVHKEMMIMVRQLDPTPRGLPLELYMFANTIVWAQYEGIVADIFDHTLASMKYFDLEVFEEVSNPIIFDQPHVKLQPAETSTDI
ncbi:MAG: mechanosensitive ion channel family protein [Candidatus Saccharimonadaceae bacterium]